MKIQRSIIFGGIMMSSAACPAFVGDTVTYSYDVLGRLVTTSASGGPSSGVISATAFDPAGNRTGYTVSGAASSWAPAPPASSAQKPQPLVPVFKLDVE